MTKRLVRARLRCARFILSAALLLPAASLRAEDEADLELGRQVFVELATPQCSICHVLADAEAVGKIAPSLDELKPTSERVRAAVIDGPGAMPSYAELLSEEQIEAVAHYVATVAGP